MHKPSVIVKSLVVKTQDNTVLDGISFSLTSDTHLAVTGKAGSGKTTLAKALAGKIHFSGSVVTNYTDISHPRIELTGQRYTFKNLSGISDFYYQQRFNSFDAEDAPSVLDELVKISVEEDATKKESEIIHTLETLGIGHLLHSPLIQLSSGEHKKFQLAKALINPPHLLILDTPYTGLDVQAVKKLNTILEDIILRGTQIILIPGTFPLPSFITHVAFIENKRIGFFEEKDSLDPQKYLLQEEEEELLYNTEQLPVSDGEYQCETIAEMKDVSIKYGSHIILEHLNWKINRGDKWLLKGRNGTGKSSLLSMITGDHPQAYSNEIYLFGKRRGTGETIWDIKQKTGYISPELHAYFDKNITCFNAIGSGYFDTIGLFKKLNTTQHNGILQWLDFLQLSHVSNKPLHSISAGLQRMVLLARALVKNPPLLVLDEPCQGLDHKQSYQFTTLIDSICSRSATTLIYVSHDESNIPACIQKVLQLETGKHTTYVINSKPALAVA